MLKNQTAPMLLHAKPYGRPEDSIGTKGKETKGRDKKTRGANGGNQSRIRQRYQRIENVDQVTGGETSMQDLLREMHN